MRRSLFTEINKNLSRKKSTFSDALNFFSSILYSAEDIMTTKKNHTICGFKSGIVNILPLVIDRPKWNQEKENMKENNLIYIQLSDSKLTADWRFGKV